MAYSYAVSTGNGSTTQFNIPFNYIRKEHIKVYVNYVDTAYTYVNASTVQLAAAPASPLRVEVRRVTPLANVLVDYTDGSTLVAADLDTSNLQSLYIEQELDDNQKRGMFVDDATGLITVGGQRITNLGNPINAQDAATKTYVDTTVSAGIADGIKGDITVSDNGTIYTINNNAINVKSFGATGTYDEAVDQGPAIQAAIAAAYANAGNTGAIVYFPPGMYRVTSPIRTGLTGNNIKLIGAGPVQSAIVQATAGANGFEHGYNPVTIVVTNNVATVTCLYPHGFTTGTIGSGNQGPLARLSIEFLGPKAVTVTNSTVFTCPATIANGSYTGGFLRPGYDRSFSVEGLSFYCGNSTTPNVQGGNAAIVVLDPNGPYQHVWQYVTFKGANFNGSNSWAQGVTIYGPSLVQWNHVNVVGKPNAQTQTLTGATGLTLATYSQTNNTTGQMVGAYASLFYKCHFDFWTQAIDMQSIHQSNPAGAEIHGLEGIVFDKIEAGGHHFCKHTSNLGNQAKALSFKFIDCNMEMSGNAFDLQSINNVQIIRGTLLMNGGDVGNVPSGQFIYDDVFRFTNCNAGLVSDVEINFFFSIGSIGAGPNNRKRYIYNFASGGQGNKAIIVSGNAWDVRYKYGQNVLSNVESAIFIASDSQKIAEKDTNIVLYEGNSPILTKQAGLPANSGCFSTAYINSFVDGSNFVTCDDYGNVELRAQGVVTPDGNRIATVALPAGLFSSVNELIQVQMSGTATADVLGYHIPVAMINTDPTPPTTASFKIKYGAGTGMDNKTHRISYYISGKA